MREAARVKSARAVCETGRMADNPLNAVNRGVYISDNLPFLKSLNDGCIDLVCIDPPFAKNETFGRKNAKAPDPLKPPLTEAERETELALLKRWGIRNEQDAARAGIDWPETRYKDIWSWQDVHEEWLKDIEESYTGVHKLIEATQEIHSEGTAAYLCYMAVRLFEIQRVLKDTGSLYLHCDHTAGAYLRQLLDAIFGRPQFQNEIVWRSRQEKGNLATKQMVRAHDTIIWYIKTQKAEYDIQYLPYRESYIKEAYKRVDQHGRYQTLPCTNETGGNQEYEFRGITRAWRFEKSRMQEMYENGLLYQATPTSPWRYKKYLKDAQGVKLEDLWEDIGGARGEERTGYPTQKPVALAERIIKASCPEGGVVLDCFAGCAYVAVAAERLNRNWLACDINPRAWTVFKRQFSKPKLALLTCAEPTQNAQPAMIGNIVTVHGPSEPPVRTTPETDDTPPPLKLEDKPRQFKVPASIIPEPEMLELLLEMSGYTAWCCGFANRKANGQIVRTTRNFHLDHMAPKSKDGTSNEIHNRAPMCPYHNIRKSNQQIMLAQYREQIAKAGELMVDSIFDLVNLNEAQAQAMQIYGQAYAIKHPQGQMRL